MTPPDVQWFSPRLVESQILAWRGSAAWLGYRTMVRSPDGTERPIPCTCATGDRIVLIPTDDTEALPA